MWKMCLNTIYLSNNNANNKLSENRETVIEYNIVLDVT